MSVDAIFSRRAIRGAIVLRGSVSRPTELVVTLTRRRAATPGADSPSATHGLTISTGPFVERLALSARLAPGAYVLRASPRGGLVPQARAVTIPGPPTGAVQAASFSATRYGPVAARLPGSRHALHVRFVFSSLPWPGLPISITFVRPGGRPNSPLVKPRARVVSGVIAATPALSPGRWRAVLRVDRVAVRIIEVRIG